MVLDDSTGARDALGIPVNPSGNNAVHNDIAGWYKTLTSSRVRTPAVTTGSWVARKYENSIPEPNAVQERLCDGVRGAQSSACVSMFELPDAVGKGRNCAQVSAEPTRTCSLPLRDSSFG